MPIEQIVALVTAIGGAAGFWQYLNNKAEKENDRLMADKEQRAEFNTTLRAQVESLSEKVDKLVSEKEDLLEAMADLKADLAAAQATVQHLQNVIGLRQEYKQ